MVDTIEVIYEKERWLLLKKLRDETASLMRPLIASHLDPIAYGSVARGDVSEDSDIDIFVARPPNPTLLIALIEEAGMTIYSREILQATPTYAAKGYIYVGDKRGFSFPLVKLRPFEMDFYGFAGSITLQQIGKNLRVPGVNKQLKLVEPTESGHKESQIQGREGEVAKILGVGVTVVLDRVRTLTRREKIGRTGVYIKCKLTPEESFGEVFRDLAKRRPALRRRLRM